MKAKIKGNTISPVRHQRQNEKTAKRYTFGSEGSGISGSSTGGITSIF
jgi:hypothetical protein